MPRTRVESPVTVHTCKALHLCCAVRASRALCAAAMRAFDLSLVSSAAASEIESMFRAEEFSSLPRVRPRNSEITVV